MPQDERLEGVLDHPADRRLTGQREIIVATPVRGRESAELESIMGFFVNALPVRLRIEGVARFVKSVRPDVLCLQETKCPDDRFPIKRFKRLGYEYIALNGQKG